MLPSLFIVILNIPLWYNSRFHVNTYSNLLATNDTANTLDVASLGTARVNHSETRKSQTQAS